MSKLICGGRSVGPPTGSRNCPATCEDTLAHSVVRYAPSDPLERNRVIVTKCDLLIACPQYRTEEQRSGTWAARRRNRTIQNLEGVIMPFLSGSVSLQRLTVPGALPPVDDDLLDKLREHAFGKEQIANADGVERGWAAGKHILDRDFSLEKNCYPSHLAWDYRVRTNKLPTDRLKAYYETDLAALAKGNPSGIASLRQRKEARESARKRLEEEAKDGRYTRDKVTPCLWDVSRREVYLGATSTAVLSSFDAVGATVATGNEAGRRHVLRVDAEGLLEERGGRPAYPKHVVQSSPESCRGKRASRSSGTTRSSSSNSPPSRSRSPPRSCRSRKPNRRGAASRNGST